MLVSRLLAVLWSFTVFGVLLTIFGVTLFMLEEIDGIGRLRATLLLLGFPSVTLT